MNELITKILEKHRIQTNPKLLGVSDLEKAIIEICEEQKKECAKNCLSMDYVLALHSKNIAE